MKKIVLLMLIIVLNTPLVFAGPDNTIPVKPTENPLDKKELPLPEAGKGVGLEGKDSVNAVLPSNLPRFTLRSEGDPVKGVESVLLNYVISPIFLLSGGVAVIMILYSSFRIITARGEEEGLTAAKNTLIWAAAGLGLIMLSYTIVRNVIILFLEKI